MNNKNAQSSPCLNAGFTLVELAIVMTIIGLLIGGILKGQELMLNARLTATIAQVNSYAAATQTFRDAYSAIPGDFRAAETSIPGCTAACDPLGNGGNSIVGTPTWSSTWNNTGNHLATGGAAPVREHSLFWLHLGLADLISGISPEALTATTASWGITHPAARLQGGFIVGYLDGVGLLPGSTGTTTPPSGHFVILVNAINANLQSVAGRLPATAAKIAQIDRKMDDGRPASGMVHAYGVDTSCYTSSTLLQYDESAVGQDCGAAFKIF